MLIDAVKTGFKRGLFCCWTLVKIMVPIYICVTFIKYSPLMGWITALFSPIMRIFNLPGEAAVPWITGIFSDEYGTVAAVKAVGLAGFDITVVAIMSMMAHALFIEAAIIKKLGLGVTFFTGYRLIAAVITGIIFGWVGGLF